MDPTNFLLAFKEDDVARSALPDAPVVRETPPRRRVRSSAAARLSAGALRRLADGIDGGRRRAQTT